MIMHSVKNTICLEIICFCAQLGVLLCSVSDL